MISVIIPIYNSEDTILRTVDSVLNQSYENIELILVNDGSKDNSLNLIKNKYGGNDKVVILDQVNKGVSSARNTGIKHANGNFIGFVDSDDLIEKDMYLNMIKDIESNKTDICFTNIIVEDTKGDIAYDKKVQSKKYLKYDILHEIIPRFLSGESLDDSGNIIKGSVCRTLIRSDFYKKNSVLFNENVRYMEDLIFIFELVCKSNSISFTNSYDYRYIHRFNSTVFSYNPDLINSIVYSETILNSIIEKNKLHDILKARLNLRKVNLTKTLILNVMSGKNNESFWHKFNQIKKITNDPSLKIHYELLEVDKSSLSNKIFIFLLKRKNNLMIYYMYKLISRK